MKKTLDPLVAATVSPSCHAARMETKEWHGQAIALSDTDEEIAVIGDFDGYGLMAVAKDRREYLVSKGAIIRYTKHHVVLDSRALGQGTRDGLQYATSRA